MVAKAASPCDVLVIGAGAAGSLLAARLSEAGKSVVVLDAGPGWSQKDLVSSQIWSRRLRWGGPFIASHGGNPIGFGFNAGWGLGGAALHHYGTWPRLHAEDFRVKSLYGVGLDWPIEYDDLAPFYDAVQEEVGVSGDIAAETWRTDSTPYPMPPLARTRQADILERGFKALGLPVAPSPMAINSVPYKGRPACLYDGWCDAGCPILALANPLAVYQPLARRHGCQFHGDRPVTRVTLDRPDRVNGAFYRDGGGVEWFQPARLVILAASVVNNPAILLNSAAPAHPNGLGNRWDQVGRSVMSHYGTSVLGLFAEETEPHLGVTGAQLLCQADYRKDAHDAPAFGSFQWLVAPSIKPNDIAGIAASRFDLTGQALDDFVRRAVNHIGNMVGMAEQLPDSDNRVTLSQERTPWGTRAAILTNRYSASEQALWQKMQAQGLQILKAAGAGEAWSTGPMTAHLMGGTIMGGDPQDSVTDSFGRVHDMRNLFIAGAGLFPTSGAANPTFTLHALADRSATELIRHWHRYV